MLTVEKRKHAIVVVGNKWNQLIEEIGSDGIDMVESAKMLMTETLAAVDAMDKNDREKYVEQCLRIAAVAMHAASHTSEEESEEED